MRNATQRGKAGTRGEYGTGHSEVLEDLAESLTVRAFVVSHWVLVVQVPPGARIGSSAARAAVLGCSAELQRHWLRVQRHGAT